MSGRILERLNLLESYVRRFEAQADADLDDPVQRAANGFLRMQSKVLKRLPVPERLVSGPVPTSLA